MWMHLTIYYFNPFRNQWIPVLVPPNKVYCSVSEATTRYVIHWGDFGGTTIHVERAPSQQVMGLDCMTGVDEGSWKYAVSAKDFAEQWRK